MCRRRATVPVATPGEWACGGSQWRMGPTFFKCHVDIVGSINYYLSVAKYVNADNWGCCQHVCDTGNTHVFCMFVFLGLLSISHLSILSSVFQYMVIKMPL